MAALYLGYFGRAGDPTGHSFWEAKYAATSAAGQPDALLAVI